MPLTKALVDAIPVQYENAHEPDIDPELMPISKGLTVLFWLTCFSVVAGSTLKYALTLQREIVQLPDSTTTDDITFAQYSGIKSQNPICPCTRPAIPIGSFANITPFVFPLVSNVLQLVNSPNASIAYAQAPGLRLEYQAQNSAAELFTACNDAVAETITGMLQSSFIMSQVVNKEVVSEDLYARLLATRATGAAALRNAIKADFLWAAVNLRTLGLFTQLSGAYSTRVYVMINEPANNITNSTGTTGVFVDQNGSFNFHPLPNLFMAVGSMPDDTPCEAGNYVSACDKFATTLSAPIGTRPSNRPRIDVVDSLCKDPTNATALALFAPLAAVNFTQWCWMAGMEKFQDQPVAPRMNIWQDAVNSLTLYNLTVTVDHEVLFRSCAPVSCSYASVSYPSPGQVVSFATSLYGGVASIAGTVYALLWTLKLKHSAHRKKGATNQQQQTTQLRETAEQLPSTTTP